MFYTVKPQKLNYIIHDPNAVLTTANYLLDILIETNIDKVERAMQETIDSEKTDIN